MKALPFVVISAAGIAALSGRATPKSAPPRVAGFVESEWTKTYRCGNNCGGTQHSVTLLANHRYEHSAAGCFSHMGDNGTWEFKDGFRVLQDDHKKLPKVRYWPITWHGRHFLIAYGELAGFAALAREAKNPWDDKLNGRYNSSLTEDLAEDIPKPKISGPGGPSLPAGFDRFYRSGAVKAKVVASHGKAVTIDKGSVDGISAGMLLGGSAGQFDEGAVIEVNDVQRQAATCRIVYSSPRSLKHLRSVRFTTGDLNGRVLVTYGPYSAGGPAAMVPSR